MKLTPLDIRKQDFTRTFRGYDEDEVQAFLQMVSEQWDEMVDLHRRLELRMQDLENKVRHYERVEEALHEALSTARQNAKHIVEGAEREARQHTQEAEAKARAVVRGAERQRDRLRQEAQELLDRRAAIAARLRALLTTELEMLGRFDQMDLPDLRADQGPPEALDHAVGEGRFFSDDVSEEPADWSDEDDGASPIPAIDAGEGGSEEEDARSESGTPHGRGSDSDAEEHAYDTNEPGAGQPQAEDAVAWKPSQPEAYEEPRGAEVAPYDSEAGPLSDEPEGEPEQEPFRPRDDEGAPGAFAERAEDDEVAASREEIERIRQILRDLD